MNGLAQVEKREEISCLWQQTKFLPSLKQTYLTYLECPTGREESKQGQRPKCRGQLCGGATRAIRGYDIHDEFFVVLLLENTLQRKELRTRD